MKARCAGDDLAVNLWDLGSGRLVKSMEGHSSRVHSLAFSAESAVLVSGSADCTMRVWDVKSAKKQASNVALVPGSAGLGLLGRGGADRDREREQEKWVANAFPRNGMDPRKGTAG